MLEEECPCPELPSCSTDSLPTSAAADGQTLAPEEETSSVGEPPLFIRHLGERYQSLKALEQLKPNFVILFNVDLLVMRQLEVFLVHIDVQYCSIAQ